ncbi:aminopeptidase Y [Obelidium mucronatum]|nr:aminopeptidase Y [Obelidium mucronatum]
MTETTPLLPTENHSAPRPRCIARVFRAAIAAGAIVAVLVLVLSPFSRDIKLDEEITRARLHSHLEAFSALAKKHNGSRSVTNGYRASVDYVVSQLKKHTDYRVTEQEFEFPFFEKYAPGSLEFSSSEAQSSAMGPKLVSGRDFEPFRNSGNGTIQNALLVPVALGCALSDFAKVTKGATVLLSREASELGSPEKCSYRDKVKNAALVGASAVLVYSSLPSAGAVQGTAPLEAKNIPVFGITHSIALFLLQKLAVHAELLVSLESAVRFVQLKTWNVLAETIGGDDENVVLAGSHLDSVPAGAGINDDASGSSATLQVALSLHATGLSKKVVNKVRFAWWSAEELGLIGSNHYVDDLAKNNPDELKRIALNLNNDMIASPNGARFIYNGREAVDPKLRGPSGVIQSIFENYFDSKGKAHEPTEFDGRSDYGGFLRHGIPAGGLFTGAEVLKTEEQWKKFGGTPGVAFDPCYHLSCDTLQNIEGLGMDLFVDLAGSMGHIVQKLAYVKDLRGFLSGAKE